MTVLDRLFRRKKDPDPNEELIKQAQAVHDQAKVALTKAKRVSELEPARLELRRLEQRRRPAAR